MICDSFDRHNYVEKRGAKLMGGIAIMFFFWLLCSMPTNTHTFLFKSVISDKVTQDIATTEGYLKQIQDNVVSKDAINLKIEELREAVEAKLVDLAAELNNPNNPGNGPEANRILRELAPILGVDKIEPLSGPVNTVQDRNNLVDAYRSKIYAIRDAKAKSIEAKMSPTSDNYQKDAKSRLEELQVVSDKIAKSELDLGDAKDFEEVCKKINLGYETIKMYKDYVSFNNDADEKLYTADKSITNVQRMKSVIEVWKDFFAGEFAGHGVFFWILLSILVDVGGFIFFELTFKKEY